MSSASIALLLSRLDGVKASGKGWRARCPSCGGRSSKVSIAEGDDGRALIHCFGGCEVAAVLIAAGLQLSDLFPERFPEDSAESRLRMRRVARESQWGAALEMLAQEARVVHFAAYEVKGGRKLDQADVARLMAAADRIGDARAILRSQPLYRPRSMTP
jgi:hypothetical protein